MVCKATSAAGSPHANSDENPYEVCGFASFFPKRRLIFIVYCITF